METVRAPQREPAADRAGPVRRVATRPAGLPAPRAVVGGLLVALAGMGTFLTWQRAAATPDRAYAVAARPLSPGDTVTADAVRFQAIDLPAGVAAAAFGAPADLEGRVLLAPVGEGELLQRGVLSDQGDTAPAAEVSLTLARERAVDGRLAAGDTVDVYATDGGGTAVVAAGVRVVAVSDAGGSLGGGELTVTLALTEPPTPLIDAARRGEVTLVRTTHAARAGGASAAPAPARGAATDPPTGTGPEAPGAPAPPATGPGPAEGSGGGAPAPATGDGAQAGGA